VHFHARIRIFHFNPADFVTGDTGLPDYGTEKVSGSDTVPLPHTEKEADPRLGTRTDPALL
jgi:hypothetical protein